MPLTGEAAKRKSNHVAITNLSSHNGMTASAEARGEEAINTKLDELGVSGTDQLENMRDLTAAQLMEMNLGMDGVSLIVDGHIFPKSPAEIFAEGSHNAVPLIAGVNDGEGLFFIRPGRTFETVEEQRTARVEEFGEHAGSLLDTSLSHRRLVWSLFSKASP